MSLRAPSRLLPWLICALALPALAEEPVDLEMVTRIRDEGFHRSQVMKTLSHLTDVIGPRLTGSPGMIEANHWTLEQLEAWGLENGTLEPVEVGRGWSFSQASVRVVSPREVPVSALPEAWTPGTDGPVRGEVMRVKIEKVEDLEPLRGKVAGKILFVDEPRDIERGEDPAVERLTADELTEMSLFHFPSGRLEAFIQRYRKRWELARALNDFTVAEGVVALVSISSFDHGIVRVGGGGSREIGGNPGVPSLVMAAEPYNWILRLLDAAPEGREDGEDAGEDDGGAAVVLEIDVRARFYDELPNAFNTLAEIPGSDPAAGLVMAGAHLDSWHSGTGATDDGAGCAVVMEAARILRALGIHPRRTIRFALWTGEEQGLFGSRHHVAEHFAARPEPTDPEQKKLPPFLRETTGPLSFEQPDYDRFAAYFNLDNGAGRIRGIYTQENAAVVPIFEAWLRPFHDLGATTVTQNPTRGTDHQAFDRVGLPGFQFIQDGLDYDNRTHHSELDVLDYVDEKDLEQASVIMASFLYQAAMRAERLPRKPLAAD